MMVIQVAPTAPTRKAPPAPVHGRVPVRHQGRMAARACGASTRPLRVRPGGASARYPGTAVRTSRAPHARQPGAARPITPVATVALALVAAGITIWLGLVAHLGSATAGGAAALPDRLGVVRVQNGETLQHLAARVAPDAPTGQVVDRIRELNRLDSVMLAAGQTLIAPIG